jgi:hypothetical protein
MNDNIIYSAMRSLCATVADFWAKYIRPVKFDYVFYFPGVRVHVVIEEHKTDDDTKPLRRVDEDDLIAD